MREATVDMVATADMREGDTEDMQLRPLPLQEEAQEGAALVLEQEEEGDLAGLGEHPEVDVDSEEGHQDLELVEPEEEEDLELEEVVDSVEEEVEWAELDGRREEVMFGESV